MNKSVLYKLLNYPPKETMKRILPNFYFNKFYRLRNFPRYTPTTTKLFNRRIRLVDSASFLSTYPEIFEREIYKFKSDSSQPYIIDCGSNIGLSIIYFKHLYPDAEVIGFEPDPKIFEALEYNINLFKFTKVHLIKKGVWNTDTDLYFSSRQDDSGHIVEKGVESNPIKIQTVSLRKYLNRTVDFLKIDIEGAETEVLKDCKDILINVKNIFLEYHSFIGKKQSIAEILDILNTAGLRCYIQHAGVISNQPFYKGASDIGMDMRLNIYGHRLEK